MLFSSNFHFKIFSKKPGALGGGYFRKPMRRDYPQLLSGGAGNRYLGDITRQYSDCRKIEPHILAVCALAGKV